MGPGLDMVLCEGAALAVIGMSSLIGKYVSSAKQTLGEADDTEILKKRLSDIGHDE